MLKEDRYYLRNPDVVIVSTTRHCLFVGDDGSVMKQEVRNSADWSGLMQELMLPVRGDALGKLLRDKFHIDADELGPLINNGVLIDASEPQQLEEQRDSLLTDNEGYYLKRCEAKCGHLVIGITGSIVAGLMAPSILSLCYSGFQKAIDLIITESALRFVNRDLFEHYGIRTWVNAFERRDDISVPHVSLGQSADCVLVMPATASSCNRLANGTSSDLLSMTIAASNAPVVVAPVMNTSMWNHKPVQRNIQQMRDDGMYIIEPTIIFGAADLTEKGTPMYGGPGTFWRGGLGLMQTLAAILEHHASK